MTREPADTIPNAAKVAEAYQHVDDCQHEQRAVMARPMRYLRPTLSSLWQAGERQGAWHPDRDRWRTEPFLPHLAGSCALRSGG